MKPEEAPNGRLVGHPIPTGIPAPVEGVPWKYAAPDGYVYYGVLGKTRCPFCRKWRDRFVLAGMVLTVVILAYEATRFYLENRD